MRERNGREGKSMGEEIIENCSFEPQGINDHFSTIECEKAKVVILIWEEKNCFSRYSSRYSSIYSSSNLSIALAALDQVSPIAPLV